MHAHSLYSYKSPTGSEVSKTLSQVWQSFPYVWLSPRFLASSGVKWPQKSPGSVMKVSDVATNAEGVGQHFSFQNIVRREIPPMAGSA